MTDEQLERLLQERRTGASEIRLGTDVAYGVGGTATARIDSISRGERTVAVYRNGVRVEQLIASRDQVRKLILAGARPAPIDVEKMELDAESP